jgi:hypothetical protein
LDLNPFLEDWALAHYCLLSLTLRNATPANKKWYLVSKKKKKPFDYSLCENQKPIIFGGFN